MPTTPHIERHFRAADVVRDLVIGMSDGLTVPFALTAGLSEAVASTAVVVTAGLAEIAAGAIAMGLGGYLAARTDREHYEAERSREWAETEQIPHTELEEVRAIFREYGLGDAETGPLLAALSADRGRWVDFMMRFELGLEAPAPARAVRSALTIAGAYVAGGLIPLAPYVLVAARGRALAVSVAVTLSALFGFGVVKGRFTGLDPLRGGLQTLVTGGLAAAAAFAIARLVT
ncbi:MAG TPA: VIT1/CCC1 transporter family protein [Candidatus Binatia bacterium]|nr:VIT1/CCC1 transporter family protein [Candidatus Binatia bacterium]